MSDEILEQPPSRLIRLSEVQHRVGLGRSTIYDWMNKGKFPKAHSLSRYNVRWLESDIDEWIAAKSSLNTSQ
ncbi:AlpA family transcriptional regulator [Sphingorhabdus sp. EL138]|uniref:helix-turn-helix transcriptional regulator n=1 Tax=Sphingorhabdus sp. EL138 TaxID=2073156 RepID=UPI000D689FF2